MTKKILVVLLVLLMVFSFVACGQKEATNKLVVGFDAEFPPYGFVGADGNYDGFDLALAKEVASRIGYEFECIAIDWNSKDADLKAGTINCIWNGFTMNGREDQYTWSDAYVDNTIVIVAKEESGIKTFDDLAGKTIMTQAGSSALDAINSEDNAALKATFKEVVELADYNLGFLELDQNTVDAVVIDLGVANYQIANRDGKYVILDGTVSTEQYGVGFLLGNTELRDLVNDTLKEMAADGTMLEIAKNYEEYGLSLTSLCMID